MSQQPHEAIVSEIEPHSPSPRSRYAATNLLVSFKHAWAGIVYASATQRNFRLDILIAMVAIALSIVLHLTLTETTIVILTIALVMALELLNTAIEAVVDLTVGQTYHELAKIAKDCAAAAVLVGAIASVSIAGCLFVPPFLEIIGDR